MRSGICPLFEFLFTDPHGHDFGMWMSTSLLAKGYIRPSLLVHRSTLHTRNSQHRQKMKFSIGAVASLLVLSSSASAFTIKFVNKCSYTVWPAVGKAPNGSPDNSVRFGTKLASGASASFGVDDHALVCTSSYSLSSSR